MESGTVDASSPRRPTLLYDGDCRLCTAFARFVRWADRGDRLQVLPFQTAEGRALLAGWSVEAIEASAHVVLPDGRVTSGGDALGRVVDELPLVGPVHRQVAASPVVRALDALLYRLGVGLRVRTVCLLPSGPPS